MKYNNKKRKREEKTKKSRMKSDLTIRKMRYPQRISKRTKTSFPNTGLTNIFGVIRYAEQTICQTCG